MSVWIQNLKGHLEHHPVIILHGNVRDRYIDETKCSYENLTSLLEKIARSMSFSELAFYDLLASEHRLSLLGKPQTAQDETDQPKDDLGSTAPKKTSEKKPNSTQMLELWQRELSNGAESSFLVLFYLDKLITYKTSYPKEEEEILLRLEKIIENITPNNRLVLVSLQDSMIPVELYTNSPKTTVISIPVPDTSDRRAYLAHRLGDQHRYLDLIANLTEGLFLLDLYNIAKILERDTPGDMEIRRKVNRYRVGEQQDYWSQLSIERLDKAVEWFEGEGGVKGQREALRKVVDMLSLARAGLSGLASGTITKPKGVLFFAGPTGVGKTFMAKKLAGFLFYTEAFLPFDMSEFKEEHTVSKLIGSPPGYVGYERGGLLTNAVREKPFSVILFDEVEKAHPKILDIFLQLLDEGRLTDSRGQTIFFTETVIIFTSNLGARARDSRGNVAKEQKDLDKILGDSQLDDEEKKRRVREHFKEAVERFFMTEISRPELLNRIGSNIVPFNYIHTQEIQVEIAKSHLRRISEEFADRHRAAGYQLEFDSTPVSEWLVQKYGSRIGKFGGRGITNAIEDETMIPLAWAVLQAEHYKRQDIKFRIRLSPDGKILAEEAGR